MLDDRTTVRTRIEEVVKKVVRPAVYPQRAPLGITAHHVHGEPIPVDEARQRPFEPFAVGQRWGGRWDTTWFRLQGSVPEAWSGEEVVALLDLGGLGPGPGFTCEGQLWIGDEPVHGFHPRHKEHLIGRPANGGESVDLLVEAAANPVPPFGVSDWPEFGADYDGPAIYVLKQAELAAVDREVEALWFDMRALTQLVDAVPDQPRNNQALQALWAAVNALDLRDVRGTAKAARAALAPALAQPARAGHRVVAVGHAHIDSAWLWPVRETKRKCVRTFSNQLRLLDEYPEHRFSCSQAQQYAWVKERHPRLWARIQEQVAAGRWEPVGGMWVEPDTNVPSGESLVRQVVHGKRFFLDELGVETSELWIPDVFGYSAALPQIARQAGITALITQKLSWNTVNKFPHSTFWWEGLDGSRLLTHFPPANTYNGVWTVEELTRSVADFADHGRSDVSLYPFGFGDGGGGPTREMLEMARRVGDLDGVPRTEIGTVAGFLDEIAADADGLDTWVGELYLEYHRGTYTTHADVKWGNRRGEEALRAAELWASAACVTAGSWDGYPAAELDEAWKLLLLNQFHDIIPGSSIGWVYEDARRDHGTILDTCRKIVANAQAALAGAGTGTVVFNDAASDRHEVADVPAALVPDGVTAQPLPADRALVRASAPACGWSPLQPELGEKRSADALLSGTSSMENGLLRVTWDADGLLTSVHDLEADREVLADGRCGNLFQLHEDHPNDYDAWDVDLTYLDQVTDLVDVESIEVVEEGPLRAAVRMVRRFGDSTITQTMRLAAGSRRLEFDTEVDWQERHRFLKVAFPVAVRSSRATYEIQHGHIERPTVVNTSWDLARYEVCAQRWADLGETGYGVALLNDGKYGYDIRGDVMRLSLLRGPGWPDPEADRGVHRFSYALLPHEGSVAEAGVAAEAEAFNLPLVAVPGSAGAASVVSVDRPGVTVEAVKKADRGDELIVRVCEVAGSRGPCRLTLAVPVAAAVRTDLLEREVEAVAVDDDGRTVMLSLRPFELVTLAFTLA